MSALAFPWPRVSRPVAFNTTFPPASSTSTKVAVPLYWALIGPDFDLDHAPVLVALDLLQLSPGKHRGDPFQIGENLPSLGNRYRHPKLVVQFHVSKSSLVSMSIGSPGHGTSRTRSGRRAHDDSSTLVTARRQEVPNRRGQLDRIASLPMVGRHGYRGVARGHRPPRFRVDEGLVGQADDDGVHRRPPGRRHRDLQRRGLARLPIRVHECLGLLGQNMGQVGGPGDDPGAVKTGGYGVGNGPPGERPAPPRRQQLVGGVRTRGESGAAPAASTTAATRPKRGSRWSYPCWSESLPHPGQIPVHRTLADREATELPCRYATQ